MCVANGLDLGTGEAVVTEVELREGVKRDQIIASNLADEVVEQHEGFCTAWKTTGNSL